MLLTVFACATQFVSTLILVAFGYAEARLGLLFGGIQIVAASIISSRL